MVTCAELPSSIYNEIVNNIPVTCIKLTQEIEKDTQMDQHHENVKIEGNVFKRNEGVSHSDPNLIMINCESRGYENVNNWIECHVFDTKLDAIAIDCEWLATWFRMEEAEKVCLIQLSTSDACLVINVKEVEILPSHLVTLLRSEFIRKVGVNVNGDATRIKRDFSVEVCNFHDLSIAAKGLGSRSLRSLESMVSHFLKKEVDKDKSLSCSDWSLWPLQERQLQYAALDAILTFEVYEKGPPQIREQQSPPKRISEEEENNEEDEKKQKEKHSKDKDQKTSTTSASVSDFFIMMRNKSIVPPNRGIKQHPTIRYNDLINLIDDENDNDDNKRNTKQGNKKVQKKALNGLTLVVSGVLDSFTREEFYDYVKYHGANVSKSVTQKVTHLISDHGEVGASKKKLATKFQIPIVGEDTILGIVQSYIDTKPCIKKEKNYNLLSELPPRGLASNEEEENVISNYNEATKENDSASFIVKRGSKRKKPSYEKTKENRKSNDCSSNACEEHLLTKRAYPLRNTRKVSYTN